MTTDETEILIIIKTLSDVKSITLTGLYTPVYVSERWAGHKSKSGTVFFRDTL